MSSTDINILRCLIAAYDVYLTGTSSIWLPKPDGMPNMQKLAPQVNNRVEVNPVNTQTVKFDNNAIFEIQQQMPTINHFTLLLVLNPVTATGASYIRWTNDFVFRLIRRLTFYDTSRGQFTTYGPETYENWFDTLPYTEQETAKIQYHIGYPNGHYSTLANGMVQLRIPVKCWINERNENILHAQNMDTPFNVKFEFEKLSNLIVTDGTSPACTIESCVLSMEGFIPTESERNTAAAILNSKIGQLLQMNDTYSQEMGTIASGFVGTKPFDIDYIKGPVHRLNISFIADSDYTQHIYDNRLRSYYPDFIEIKTGNEYILQNCPVELLLETERAKKFKNSLPESRQLKICFNQLPEKICHVNSGYLDFNFLGKPQIHFIYNHAVPTNLRVNINAETTKFGQVQAGTIRPVTTA